MNKKLLIVNTLTVLLALFILFLGSVSLIIVNNNKTYKEVLTDRLDLATSLYDGTNEVYVNDVISTKEKSPILVIYSLDDQVLYSSVDVSNVTSFSNKSKLGDNEVYGTLNQGISYIYVSTIDSNHIIQIILEKDDNSNFLNQYIISGLLLIIMITILTTIYMKRAIRNSAKPIVDVLRKVEKITGNKPLDEKGIVETLYKQVSDIETIIYQQLDQISYENDKFNRLIDSISQGIVVINDLYQVIVINNFACSLFSFDKEQVINKNYLNLIRDIKIQEKIDMVLNGKKTKSYTFNILDKYFKMHFDFVDSSWLGKHSEKYGAILIITDVTQERKTEIIKQEFFANASHELKSPLTSIIGYQQLISMGISETKDEIEEATERTLSEANRMNKIIIKMLELSKLESLKKTNKEKISLKEIILDIVDQFSLQTEQLNLKVDYDLSDTYLFMEKEHAITLVKNIYENAIKYNKVGGSISIFLDKTSLSIIDTGIGIAKTEESRVFERFYRVDKAKSKILGGTGLGLAIVKHICNLYDFKVSLESSYGVSTKVSIIFN